MPSTRGVLTSLILVALTGCADTPLPPGPTSRGLDSLIAAADSLYGAGEYAQSKASWSLGLSHLQRGRNLATEARILTSLGLTEWRLGDYDAAWKLTEQARTVLEANDLRSHLPRTYNALGLIAWDQGRLSNAADLWRRSMEVAREVGDREYLEKPAMNLGLWYTGIGELERARDAFALSLIAGRRLGIRALELRSLVNLAMVANQMGEPRLALAWLDSAAVAGVEEDFAAEDNYRSQLAVAAWALGDPGVALAGLDSALQRARRSGLRQSEAANLTLMAGIYSEAGDLARALGLLAQAQAIHGELDLIMEQGENLLSAAGIQAALGQETQARELASAALKLHLQVEDLPHQLDDRLLLAELGVPGHMTEARRIARRLSTRDARMKLGLAAARIAATAAEPISVLRALASLAPDLDSALSAEVSEAESIRGRAYASLHQWDSASASGRRAIAALERLQHGHGSGLLRSSFASFRAATYGDLVTALLALGRTDEAFETADAARGRFLQSPGTTGRSARAPLPRAEPLRRIAALEREIRDREAEGLDAGELRDRLRQTEREYEIALLNSGSGPSRLTYQSLQASEGRRALAPDELLLAYLVTPNQLFVFSLSQQETRVQVVPVRAAEVEARVRLAREMLADPTIPIQDAEAVVGTLSRWLLGPLGEHEGALRRLIVVPHGALAYLPFGALRTPGGAYVVESYSLVHLPSATFLGAVGPHPSLETSAGTSMTALAPLPHDLPASALEVAAVGKVYRGARVLVGRRARESALREALGSGAIAHVASHGVLNRVNPLFSRIDLVPASGPSTIDDGRLEVHEVLGMEIRSPLVFLSGCETGLGPGGSRRHAPGEDYATLAAAFLTSGARQVVATLWAIPDTGAAVLAGRFYQELSGTDPAEALAAAQRAQLATERFRHPYYWAGYRLAGVGPRPQSDPRGAIQSPAAVSWGIGTTHAGYR